MTWGYGHSPALKDKCYATLAIAWGPLIQLYILNNIVDEAGQIFIDDGYHVISPANASMNSSRSDSTHNEENKSTEIDSRKSSLLKEMNPYEQENRFEAIKQSVILRRDSNIINLSPFELKDQFVECIWFLSDSILLILTRSLEFKVFYT